MTTFVLITVTGLGLAGLYFLLASGLSLIFGLMHVLNLAHGALFGLGGYAAWLVMDRLSVVEDPGLRFVLALLVAAAVGFGAGGLMERTLIRRLYGRLVDQVLLTVGLGLALVALFGGLWGYDPLVLDQPRWFGEVTLVLGARIPNSRLLILLVALASFGGLLLFLDRTRHGLVIRAGVENPNMVRALGIDVERSFTLVFAVGGMLAAIGGTLGAVFFNGISPGLGTNQLVFAFIVVVIGGMGSVAGTALGALLVALTQQYVNFYAATGLGDVAVVFLLALVLMIRPQGLLGKVAP